MMIKVLSKCMSEFLVGLQFVAVSLNCSAQEFPSVPDEMQALVFENYASMLDNAIKAHNLGFHAMVIKDIDHDRQGDPEPYNCRRYGMIAELEDAKFRRAEFVGWKIGKTGIVWEQGERWINNEQGKFKQGDPGVIEKTDRSHSVSRVARFSPFAMLFSTATDVSYGEVTISRIRTLEEDMKLMKLIGAVKKDSRIEAIYLGNNHGAAIQVIFDARFGGMAQEVRVLVPEEVFKLGDSAIKPLKSIRLSEINAWQTIVVNKAFWIKLKCENDEELWFPEIVDYQERSFFEFVRTTYYFVDWRIGKQIDRSIFDPTPFEKRIPNTIYAEKEIKHEYQERQEELDSKALVLRRKWKFQ